MFVHVFSLMITCCEGICLSLLFDIFFTPKQFQRLHTYAKILFLIFFVIPTVFIFPLLSHNFLQYPSQIAYCFLLLCLFWHAPFWAKLSVVILSYAIILALDSSVLLLLRFIIQSPENIIYNNPVLFFIGTLISKIILFIIVTFVSSVFKKTRLAFMLKKAWLIIGLESIGTIITFFFIIDAYKEEKELPIHVAAIAIILLLCCIISFEMMKTTANIEEKTFENALLKQQMTMQLKNTLSRSHAENQQRKILHDYKNQMLVLHDLLNTKSIEPALAIIKTLFDQIENSIRSVQTHHPIIDAILNVKNREATEKGIELVIFAENLSALNLPEEELVVILSNVIDNALEACEKVQENRTIEIKLHIENHFFFFSVKNPVIKNIEIVDNQVRTTKPDSILHGIGLHNVALALKNCGGDFCLSCENHEFQFVSMTRFEGEIR